MSFKTNALNPINWGMGKDIGGFATILAGVIRYLDHEEDEEDLSAVFHKRRHGKYARKDHNDKLAREAIANPKKGRGGYGNGNQGGISRHDYRHGGGETKGGSTRSYGGNRMDEKQGPFAKEILDRGMLLTGSHARIKKYSVLAKCTRCNNTVMTIVDRNISRRNVAASATVVAVSIMANAFIPLVPLALAVLDMRALKTRGHFCAYCGFPFGKDPKVIIHKPEYKQLHKEMNTKSAVKHAKPYLI